MATTTDRPKVKGILSVLSDNRNDEHPEYLTYYPYDEVALRQSDQLLRRHRFKKQTLYDDTSTFTSFHTTLQQQQQQNLDDVLANTDSILFFFAEARGCAHSIRVRALVSHFCHDDDDDNNDRSEIDHDDNDNDNNNTPPSCCCICILNGPPEEDVKWKNTFLEGTGFYTLSGRAPASPNDTCSSIISNDKMTLDNESLLQNHDLQPSQSPPDRRRAALIQYVWS